MPRVKKPSGSATSSFGVTRREGHDASPFYRRNLHSQSPQPADPEALKTSPPSPPGEWADRIYCQSSEAMPIPDNAVGLAFTSPPYNVGKDYDDDLSLESYLQLIARVGKEVYRVLAPGGRYAINIANLGRKPYIPLHAYFYQIHTDIGFLPMGEIIWRKSKGSNGNCAWGSFQSARSPRLRDVHEYILVFAKQSFSRPDKGASDISREEFMQATLSVWEIPPASARQTGHPAPFPVSLAERVIRLYSYTGDVVLDPFMGSGSACVAAQQNNRHYAGFDISEAYCELAKKRLEAGRQRPA